MQRHVVDGSEGELAIEQMGEDLMLKVCNFVRRGARWRAFDDRSYRDGSARATTGGCQWSALRRGAGVDEPYRLEACILQGEAAR